jgi:hypothetical protein
MQYVPTIAELIWVEQMRQGALPKAQQLQFG